MSVQSMGIGSGLDVQLIIDELVKAEEEPRQNTIDTKTSTNQAKISALGEITSSMSSLKDAAETISSADNIISYTNNASSLTGIDMTSTATARTGSYTLNVNQLAYAHKAQMTTVADAHSFAAGSLSFSINGTSHEINWSDSETLTGLRYLINQESSTTGVQATIVNADSGDSLILSSTGVGSTSQFSVTGTGGGLDLLDYQKASQTLSSTLTHGDVIFNVGGTDYTLTIDGTNDSLADISTTLSNFFTSSGVSIETSVHNSQVVFSSASSFTVTDSAGSLFSDVSAPTQQSLIGSASQVGQDLIMTIDGLQVTSTSNIVSDAIEGVTLNITSAAGTDQNLTISADITQVSANVKAFVDQLNATSSLIDSYVTNTESVKGAFATDSTIKGIISQFRTIMSSTMSNNSLVTNYQLGIEFDRTTKSYTVNESTLQSAVANNFDDLVSFFGDSSEGIATQFYSYLDDTLDRTGLLSNLGASLNDSLSRILDDQLKLDKYVESLKLRLVKQYTAMDTTVAQLQSTGNFLTQWSESMNNSNKK